MTDPPAPSTGATAGGELDPATAFNEFDEFNEWWASRWRSTDVPKALEAAFCELALAAWAECRNRFHAAQQDELTTLRSDLAHAQAERDRLVEISTAAIEGCSEAAVEQKAQLDQLRAQLAERDSHLATLQAVVQAAQALSRSVRHHMPRNVLRIVDDRFRTTLDQAQPQQQQEVPD